MRQLTHAELIQLVYNNTRMLIDAKRMFTAFDVTMLLRKAGQHVSHSEVRPIVHDHMVYFQMYMSTVHNIHGNATAIVYHPVEADVSEYESWYIFNHIDPAGLNYSPPTGPNPTTPSNNGYSSNGTEDDEDDTSEDNDVVKLDKWNRLRIPVRYTRHAGIKPGQRVQVEIDSYRNKLTITLPVTTSAFTHTADYHGNIRVKVRGFNAKKFKLSASTSEVNAKPL